MTRNNLRYVVNIKNSLLYGLVFSLMMTACGRKSKTMIVTDEALLGNTKGFAIAARDINDGKLHTVRYADGALCSYLEPGDTLTIDFIQARGIKSTSAIRIADETYYDKGDELVVSDHQISGSRFPASNQIYVYLSDETRQKLLSKRANGKKSLLYINDSLKNANERLTQQLLAKNTVSKETKIVNTQNNRTDSEKIVVLVPVKQKQDATAQKQQQKILQEQQKQKKIPQTKTNNKKTVWTEHDKWLYGNGTFSKLSWRRLNRVIAANENGILIKDLQDNQERILKPTYDRIFMEQNSVGKWPVLATILPHDDSHTEILVSDFNDVFQPGDTIAVQINQARVTESGEYVDFTGADGAWIQAHYLHSKVIPIGGRNKYREVVMVFVPRIEDFLQDKPVKNKEFNNLKSQLLSNNQIQR